jgi:hypothetical protein
MHCSCLPDSKSRDILGEKVRCVRMLQKACQLKAMVRAGKRVMIAYVRQEYLAILLLAATHKFAGLYKAL